MPTPQEAPFPAMPQCQPPSSGVSDYYHFSCVIWISLSVDLLVSDEETEVEILRSNPDLRFLNFNQVEI